MAYCRARPSELATSRDAPLSPPDFIRLLNAGMPMDMTITMITITVSISINVNPSLRRIVITVLPALDIVLVDTDAVSRRVTTRVGVSAILPIGTLGPDEKTLVNDRVRRDEWVLISITVASVKNHFVLVLPRVHI